MKVVKKGNEVKLYLQSKHGAVIKQGSPEDSHCIKLCESFNLVMESFCIRTLCFGLLSVWYKTKFGSQNLATKFGVFLVIYVMI